MYYSSDCLIHTITGLSSLMALIAYCSNSSKKILLVSLMAFEDVSFGHNLKIKDDKKREPRSSHRLILLLVLHIAKSLIHPNFKSAPK